nr:hypothetical protein [Acinetobacter baylyi]
MSKTHSLTYTYRLTVFYRFVIAFIVGFISTIFFSITLSYLFAMALPKAEAIYLSAFCSILFYAFFVIMMFCIQSLVRLTLYSTALCLAFFLLSIGLG